VASIVSQDGNRCSDPKWKQLYQSAILELDNGKMLSKIADARSAILDRAEELLTSPYSEERHALNDALRALQILEGVVKRERQSA